MPESTWPTRAYVRLAALFAVSGAILVMLIWLVAPREYTSSTELILAGQQDMELSGALAALGGRFGLTPPGVSENPYFIVGLIKSRDVLTAVALDTFVVDEAQTLVEILTHRRPDTPKNIARARRKLRRSLSTRVNLRSDVVSVWVEMPDPDLARAVLQALVAETTAATQRIEQTQARQRRKFIERRLELARKQLLNAEERQQAFYERNVRFEQSPDLTLAERRLQREVLSRQQLATSLARDLEEALQSEASDVPTLTVITVPDLPWRKSWPSGSKLLIAGFGAGLVVATILTLLAVRIRQAATVGPLDTPRALLAAVRHGVQTWIRAVA